MKKVLLRGPLLTSSGYGEHSRQFFRWLETRDDIELKVQCLNWGTTTWYIDSEIEEGLIGRIMSKTNFDLQKESFDISIQIQLPDEWDTSIAKYNVGVSAFIETTKTTKKWYECCTKMDKVISPSMHALKSVLENGSLGKKAIVVNEPLNPLVLKKDKDFELELSTDFNFLIISQLTDMSPDLDRKNIIKTLKAFIEKFDGNKDVGLVIKTNIGRATTKDRRITKEILTNIINTHRKTQYPRIHMIHGLMTPQEMCSLYNHPKVKCFVSLTRGEGYGLPLMEAAANKLPIIATGWSGHLDFLKDFLKVKYSLIPIPEAKTDNRIFEKNTFWAEPSIDDFKEKLGLLMSDYKRFKKIAEKQSYRIKKDFSQSVFNKKMNEIIK
tara:strand:- start:12101 stop:13246 length:1146 start_codon:yes stop_codon:yes gene_type:complete